MAIDVVVPRINSNDDAVKVVDVFAVSGQRVEQGEALFTVETSKAAVEIEAPESGWIHNVAVTPQETVPVGSFLCHLATDEDEKPVAPASTPLATGSSRVSKKAALLMEENSLEQALFTGIAFVRERHVLDWLAQHDPDANPASLPVPPLPTLGPKSIVIVGGGGRARVCIDLLKLQGQYDVVGILDDGLAPGGEQLGVPVLGPWARLGELKDAGLTMVVNGVGSVTNPPLRSRVFERLKDQGFMLPNLVHPDALVESSVRMGEGNHILAGAIVSSNVTLGDNCTINCGAIASHDCHLGNNVHLTPGAVLAGAVSLGDETVIGMAATVFLKVRIGRQALVKNGAQVFGDLPDGSVFP